jgi:hypothetical protein
MPACDLDRSVAFCFYNKREKPSTLVSVFSGEVHVAGPPAAGSSRSGPWLRLSASIGRVSSLISTPG